jgi:hypothetical protein
MGTLGMLGEFAMDAAEVLEWVPGVGTVVHSAESMYHGGAGIVDQIQGDEKGASEHFSEQMIHVAEAIPLLGMMVGAAGDDAAKNFVARQGVSYHGPSSEPEPPGRTTQVFGNYSPPQPGDQNYNNNRWVNGDHPYPRGNDPAKPMSPLPPPLPQCVQPDTPTTSEAPKDDWDHIEE